MEQSKLVSSIIAKLKIAYQYYFKDLTDEEFVGLVNMYQEQIVGYRPEVILKSVNDIISKSKFMPSVAEILENCSNKEDEYKNEILKKMYDDGYFKRSVVGELDDNHAIRNYEKSLSFMKNGIIPNWLLEDMKKYGYVEYEALPNTELKQLGSGKNELV